MKHQTIAVVIAAVITLASVLGPMLADFSYARQERNHIAEAPSAQHWLGTDDLGRDRLARLLYGVRNSVLLAPVAALLSMLLAFLLGAVPGFAGGVWEQTAKSAIDLFLAIPWLFLLLIVRAMLPLNTSPEVSALITFAVLGAMGWAAAARMLLARARSLRQSDMIVLARATGSAGARLLRKQVLPNLRPILIAQFWVTVPLFILSEANLSMLGLGVSEPMPSLGALLRELESVLSLRADPVRFIPLLMLVLLISSLQIAVSDREVIR